MRFDAQAYWSQRERKIFVVSLSKGKGKHCQRDTKYVRARDRDGAIRTALLNSHVKRPSLATARLATPWDLGCTEIEPTTT